MLSLLAAVACGESTPTTLSSTPVPSEPTQRVAVLKQPNELIRPDGRKPLTVGTATTLPVQGFEQLEGDPEVVALAACNQTTAPCPTCMDEGVALSACLQVEGCENVPALLELAVRLAGEGQGYLQVQERLEWEDPWFLIPGTELPSRGEGRVLTVALDYESPFSAQAWAVLSSLEEVQLQLLPWWGEERLLAPDAAAALASLADPWPLHEALLAQPLTAERLQKLIQEHGAEPDRGRDEAHRRAALAAQLGVRGSPTVFLEGYRLRGQRSADFYRERLAALP